MFEFETVKRAIGAALIVSAFPVFTSPMAFEVLTKEGGLEALGCALFVWLLVGVGTYFGEEVETNEEYNRQLREEFKEKGKHLPAYYLKPEKGGAK